MQHFRNALPGDPLHVRLLNASDEGLPLERFLIAPRSLSARATRLSRIAVSPGSAATRRVAGRSHRSLAATRFLRSGWHAARRAGSRGQRATATGFGGTRHTARAVLRQSRRRSRQRPLILARSVFRGGDNRSDFRSLFDHGSRGRILTRGLQRGSGPVRFFGRLQRSRDDLRYFQLHPRLAQLLGQLLVLPFQSRDPLLAARPATALYSAGPCAAAPTARASLASSGAAACGTGLHRGPVPRRPRGSSSLPAGTPTAVASAAAHTRNPAVDPRVRPPMVSFPSEEWG